MTSLKNLMSREALLAALLTGFLILAFDLILDILITDRRQFFEVHLLLIVATIILLYFILQRVFAARKQAENKLLASEEQLANILKTAPDAILAVDHDLSITVFNQGAERLFGYTAGEILGQPLSTLWPVRYRQEQQQYFCEFVGAAANDPLDYVQGELYGYRKNGGEFPVDASISRLAQNGTAGLTIVLRDITIRKQAEESLRWVHEDLEHKIQARTIELTQANEALQAASEAIITVDCHGKIVSWNRAAHSMLGFTAQEARGQPLSLIIPDDLQEFHQKLFEKALGEEDRDKIRKTMELRARRKDGSEFPIQLSISVWKSRDQLFFTGIIQDITERQHAENALRLVHLELEERVLERTRALATANQELRAEIAERERVEKRLRLRTTALEAAANGIIITDQAGKILWANPAFGQMTGYSPEAVVGLTPNFLKSGVHDESFHEQLWETILAGKVWTGEVTNRRKDGILYTEEQTITPVRDEDGNVSHFIAIKQDISQRKRFELQLEHNNNELLALSRAEGQQRRFAEALVKAAIALNTSLNLDDVLDQILKHMQQVIPCQAADVMLLEGQELIIVRHRNGSSAPPGENNFAKRIPLSSFPLFLKLNQANHSLVVADTQQSGDWSLITGFEWVRSMASALLQTEKQRIGFLSLYSRESGFFDSGVTVRLQAFAAHAVVAIQNARLYHNLETLLEQEQMMRDQLIQSEKFVAMGRMLASVAHELNNPLQTIMNCLFLTQQVLGTASPVQEYLNISTSEIERLSSLVAQLRDLYRPRLQETLQPFNVAQLINELHALVLPHLQRHRVRWQLEQIDGSMTVLGLADQLKQVCLNISLNAIEAMAHEGGLLLVRAVWGDHSNEIGIVFQDSGPGIPDENISRLFEPFYTTKDFGSGLGLSISYDIVRNLGGRISVDSQSGQGTMFTVWLPSAKMKA